MSDSLGLQYNYESEGEDGRDSEPTAGADERLARELYYFLRREFPGYLWGIGVNHNQGIVALYMPGFYEKFPGTINMKDLTADPGFGIVRRVAGEMIERLGLPRTHFDAALYEELLRKNPLASRQLPMGGLGRIK